MFQKEEFAKTTILESEIGQHCVWCIEVISQVEIF